MAKKRIIDQRKKEKFMMDDDYLNGQAKLCGIYATGVYMSLCRHASKDQECFPSIKLISEELSISRDSTIKGLKSLEQHRVIEIKKRRTKGGKWLNNTYILLDKSEWSKYQVGNSDTASQVDVSVKPSRSQRLHQVGHSDTKETHTQGNTEKETHTIATPSVAEDSNAINQVFEKFQMTVNPTINYGNKTQRKAVEYLIQQFSLPKVLSTIEYIARIQDDQFAPVITTPYQLKEKMGALMAHYRKNSSKSPNVVSI